MSAALPATRPTTHGGEGAACPCGGPLGPSAGATARGTFRFDLRPCLRCGRLRLDPQPDDAALAAAYDRAYYGIGARKFLQPIESGLDLFRGGRARRLDALVAPVPGRPRRVLDVGCGDGGFLAALAARGWECHGSEFSAVTAQRAAARTGLPIRTGLLPPDAFVPGSLDAVSIWHVLEHLRDPDRVLADCARWLAPGGVLLVAVPNVSSWQARAFGGHWFHLDPPFHLFHFDPASLARTLSDAGFELAAANHFCWQYNPYGVLQSLLNALGFPRDALYDVLKGNHSVRSSPSRLLQAALAAAALPSAFLFALFESAAGAGGTFDVRAHRR